MMPVIQARGLAKDYVTARPIFGPPRTLRAVNGIDLTLQQGEILGIVGESGSGKSTLGRLLLGLETPSAGQVLYQGSPLPAIGTASWRALRAEMQMVFQDPLAALDRRMMIGAQIGEPLLIHRLCTLEALTARVLALMERVGLRADQAQRYPHELSGGQRQRVVIARALASQPKLLVCDEPVSALDVSIQAQVINLLRDLQEQSQLSMVFISHDLKVVRNLCDRVAVVYLGQVVEEGMTDEIFARPQHPYTRALISSIPRPGQGLNERILLQGEPPNPASRPSGCAFHPRCAFSDQQCTRLAPALALTASRQVACFQPQASVQSPVLAPTC